MQMPGRSYNQYTGATGYRYGMNGQEIDVEVTGNPNIYTAMFWEYDARTGRRWNQDPKPNPSISNYACFANNPILFSDPLGDTVKYGGFGDMLRVGIKRFNKDFNEHFKAYRDSRSVYTYSQKEGAPDLMDSKPDYGRKLTTNEYLNGDWNKYNIFYSTDKDGPSPTEPSPLYDKVINHGAPVGALFSATYEISPGATMKINTFGYADKFEIYSGGAQIDVINGGFFKTKSGAPFNYSFDQLYTDDKIVNNQVTIKVTSNLKVAPTAWNYTIQAPTGRVIERSKRVVNNVIHFKN